MAAFIIFGFIVFSDSDLQQSYWLAFELLPHVSLSFLRFLMMDLFQVFVLIFSLLTPECTPLSPTSCFGRIYARMARSNRVPHACYTACTPADCMSLDATLV